MMYIELDQDIDLMNWPDVLMWAAKASAKGASQLEIADAFLSAKSSIGNIRAFTHLMRASNFTKEVGLACLKPAYQNTADEVLRIIIMLSLNHLDGRRSLLDGKQNEKTNSSGMKFLSQLIEELRALNRTGMIALEAEYRLYHAMAITAINLNSPDEVEILTNRLLNLADIIGYEELSDRTKNFCITALTDVSSYSRIISLGRPQLQRELTPGMELSHEAVIADMAHAYLHLGAYNRFKSLFDEGIERFSTSSHLRNYLLWNQAQAGYLDLHATPTPDWDRIDRFGWQIEAFQELGLALAEGIHRPQQQRQHFLRMVEITNKDIDTRLTRDSTVERWLRARARLGLREYPLAIDELRAIQPPNPDDLLYRAWINALHVELGMTTLPQLLKSMPELEEEAQAIYRDAREMNNADPEGLARLTARWMPGAVAYLGRMPNGIAECRVALEDVFRITKSQESVKSRWKVTVLPPNFALSLTLDALGKEYQPVLTTNTTFQLRPLKQKIGDAEVWGPVISPVSLALGLLRAGHLDTAREWLSVTRMFPPQKGSFATVTDKVDALFKDAADGLLSFPELLREIETLPV